MDIAITGIVVLSLFAIILVASDRIGGTRVGAIADYILGAAEPFAEPDDTDEPRPLRLVTYGEPKPGESRWSGLPEVITLDMPKPTLQVRRQRHRDAFFARLARSRHDLPHPQAADRWWPGTAPSPVERRYL